MTEAAIAQSDRLAPLVLSREDAVAWEASADVVVIGYGGAGIVAALDAHERGEEVLAIDRFDGGGATAFSGGVYYGGATAYQREAGCDDSVDEMLKYLLMEAKGVVSPETMERFCRNSNRDLEWLVAHGVQFGSTLTEDKTAYPEDGKFLYYSGNERVERYSKVARPAPRGHRTVGKGFSGYAFYGALRAAADKTDIRLVTHAPVVRLIMDADGAVIGVEATKLPVEHHAAHTSLYKKVTPFAPFKAKQTERAIEAARALERAVGVTAYYRARKGVILSTGGFVYNLAMLEAHQPYLGRHYAALMRLGSMGCDGSGIALGQSAGGVADLMPSTFIGKALAPPTALLYGIVVNEAGRRFINEDAYAAFLGGAILDQPNSRAWLIVNGKTLWKVIRGCLKGRGQFARYGLPTLFNLLLGGTCFARTTDSLARKCGIDPVALKASIADNDRNAAIGSGDPLEKSVDYLKILGTGPYVAINISIANRFSFNAIFTLGGLVVDERTGGVTRADGTRIKGLYAAGRAAVGLCSRGYISGMSIADCVFSGRRAAAAAGGEAVSR